MFKALIVGIDAILLAAIGFWLFDDVKDDPRDLDISIEDDIWAFIFEAVGLILLFAGHPYLSLLVIVLAMIAAYREI